MIIGRPHQWTGRKAARRRFARPSSNH